MNYKLLFFVLFVSTNVLAKNRGFQVAGFLGTSLLNQSTTPTVASNGFGTYSANLRSTYENSPSGGLEIHSMDSDNWLLKFGVKTMPYRKVTLASLEVLGQGTQQLTILSPYSYKLTSIYYTGGYCWESFYLMVGWSYNFFEFSSPAASTPFRTKNGAGGTFGFGYKLDESWAIEYTGHSAIVAIESGTNYQTKDDFLFSDAVLSLNYGF